MENLYRIHRNHKVEWPTPQPFFDRLNDEFDFTLDPCATPQSAKCDTYFTAEDDGLVQDWGTHSVFCNPPYGRGIDRWMEKAYRSSQAGALVVVLLPMRTATNWFHNWVINKAELRFVQGCIRFEGAAHKAPFASLVAIYYPAGSTGSASILKTLPAA